MAGRPLRFAGAALAAVLAVGILGGCSEDAPTETSPTSDADGTTTSSASPSPSFTPRDLSDGVLDATLPEPKGSSDGTVDGASATFEVAEVRASATRTVLTFWYSGGDAAPARRGSANWETFPTLVDTDAERVYEPLTYTDFDGTTRCLCTDTVLVGDPPQLRTAMYPALPEDLSEVEVRQDGFEEPVTLEVTRP